MDTNNPASSSTPEKDSPEKYVRTFAGDMETLQQGGVPDLAPLAPPHPDAKERLIAASPVAPEPEPAPVPDIPPEPPPLPPLHPPSDVASLKTYAGDFSDRLKEKHASTATVIAAEQDAAAHETRTPPAETAERSRSGLLYSIAGVVLVLAGGTGAYIAYTRYITANAPVIPLQQGAAAPIFVDERQEISGSGDTLLKTIAQSAGRSLTGNSVRLLYIASTTAESVFSQLSVSAPLILVRNVNADGSMAGIVNVNGVQSPFFILSVSSYSNTFAGMLAWETLMQRDLNPLFPAYPPLFAATTTMTKTGQATTTTVLVSTTKPGFRDEVVSNHDVRVYRDPAGRVLLIYGYWNPSTLVIARDAAAFAEVLQRLANSRTQ